VGGMGASLYRCEGSSLRRRTDHAPKLASDEAAILFVTPSLAGLRWLQRARRHWVSEPTASQLPFV